MTTDISVADKPLEFLRAFESCNPKFHRHFEAARRERGRRYPDWPAHVYCADNFAMSNVDLFASFHDAQLATAMAAWRVSKSVYVFDDALTSALSETDFRKSEIPAAILRRFPDWCAYIAAGLDWCFVSPAYDLNARRDELRIIMPVGLIGYDIMSLPLPLNDGWTLRQCLDALRIPAGAFTSKGTYNTLSRIIATTAYLCADEPDYSGRDRPLPRSRGPQFGAQAPSVWHVGARIGAQLRAQTERHAAAVASGPRHGPRPHIRRAHWHGYWCGPKARPELRAKWIPPTLIGCDNDDDMPAVVRAINPTENTETTP
jgi:hypothetical protein